MTETRDGCPIEAPCTPFDSTIAVVHDATGQLVQLTLPVLGYAALETTIYRGDQVVLFMPWTIESSDSSVAWVSRNCRAAVVDPDCSVSSSGGWVTGLAAGTTMVTLTARNLHRSFTVTVE